MIRTVAGPDVRAPTDEEREQYNATIEAYSGDLAASLEHSETLYLRREAKRLIQQPLRLTNHAGATLTHVDIELHFPCEAFERHLGWDAQRVRSWRAARASSQP